MGMGMGMETLCRIIQNACNWHKEENKYFMLTEDETDSRLQRAT